MYEESLNPDELQRTRLQVAYCWDLSSHVLLILYPVSIAS